MAGGRDDEAELLRIFVAGEGFHVDEAEVRRIFVAQKCGGFVAASSSAIEQHLLPVLVGTQGT